VPASNLTTPILQAEGIIQQVDTVNRELRVQVNGTSVTFDVPPGCTVVLNQEQVKLRLLQPADRVRVVYHAGPCGVRAARRVEAQTGNSSPW
jgi:hypothetical protein